MVKNYQEKFNVKNYESKDLIAINDKIRKELIEREVWGRFRI